MALLTFAPELLQVDQLVESIICLAKAPAAATAADLALFWCPAELFAKQGLEYNDMEAVSLVIT